MGSTPQPRRYADQNANAAVAAERILPAWQVWLRALSTDAEAALGAALAYESLDATGRDAFLTAIDQDAERFSIPRVALFAPFLSVEKDPQRRGRIRAAMGTDMGTSARRRRPRALIGHMSTGERVAVIVAPLYLDFVRVISCRFSRSKGFTWVRNDPLLHCDDAPVAGSAIDGVQLDEAPLSTVIDDVALAVVAQRGPDGALPDKLDPLLDLFDARLRDWGEADPTMR